MSRESGEMEKVAAAEAAKKIEAKEIVEKSALQKLLELRQGRLNKIKELRELRAVDFAKLAEQASELTEEEKEYYKIEKKGKRKKAKKVKAEPAVIEQSSPGSEEQEDWNAREAGILAHYENRTTELKKSAESGKEERPMGTPESEKAGAELNRIYKRVRELEYELATVDAEEKILETMVLLEDKQEKLSPKQREAVIEQVISTPAKETVQVPPKKAEEEYNPQYEIVDSLEQMDADDLAGAKMDEATLLSGVSEPVAADIAEDTKNEKKAAEEEVLNVDEDMIIEEKPEATEADEIKHNLMHELTMKLLGESEEGLDSIFEKYNPSKEVLNSKEIKYLSRVLLVDRLQHPVMTSVREGGLHDAAAILRRVDFPKEFLINAKTQDLVMDALVKSLAAGEFADWQEIRNLFMEKCHIPKDVFANDMSAEGREWRKKFLAAASDGLVEGLARGSIIKDEMEDKTIIYVIEDIYKDKTLGLPGDPEVRRSLYKKAGLEALKRGRPEAFDRINKNFPGIIKYAPEEMFAAAEKGAMLLLKEGDLDRFAEINEKFPVKDFLRSEQRPIIDKAMAVALISGNLGGAVSLAEITEVSFKGEKYSKFKTAAKLVLEKSKKDTNKVKDKIKKIFGIK